MKAKNCHIGKVVDINPLCSPNNSSYLLEIYHDFKIGESGEVCNNIGHFYIGLYDEESYQVTIKGKNPKTASIPLDFGDVKEETGRIKKSLEYEQTSSKTIFTAKSVNLTFKQYYSALSMANTTSDGIFFVGVDDCLAFAQKIYNSALLPRFFTEVYTEDELNSLGSLAAKSALVRFGARDKDVIVYSNFSKERDIADMYNISELRVVKLGLIRSNGQEEHQYILLKLVLDRQENQHQSEVSESLGFLGFNKAINKKLESLKSFRPDLNDYISEKIQESQDEIRKLEGIFPGFLENCNSSMEENKPFLQSMLNSSLRAKKVDVSEFIPKLSEEDYRDAINNILPNLEDIEPENQEWMRSILESSKDIVENVQTNQDIQNLLGLSGIDLDSLENKFT